MKKLITITGCTSSGKTLIQDAVVRVNDNISKIVSTTSRPIRINEKESIDYYYISRAVAIEMLAFNEFIECRKYDVIDLAGSNTWYYGISKEDCIDNAVVVVEPHGFRQLAQMDGINVISFYIKVDERERLIRMVKRGDNLLEVFRRIFSDQGVFQFIDQEVDWVIDNNQNINDSVNKIIEFINF